MKIFSLNTKLQENNLIKIELKNSKVTIWCNLIIENEEYLLCVNKKDIIGTVLKSEVKSVRPFPKNGLCEI